MQLPYDSLYPRLLLKVVLTPQSCPPVSLKGGFVKYQGYTVTQQEYALCAHIICESGVSP